MTTTPPGRAGVDGPITGRIRAILTVRLGVASLAVVRLGFSQRETQDATVLADSGPFVPQWREDPEPGEYAPAYSGTEVIAP